MKPRFAPRRPFIPTKGQALTEQNFFNLRGLNMYQPDELLKDNASPYAQNFRIFDPFNEGSRVSISKRNGQSFYSVPVGETDSGNLTATTGAADGILTTVNWLAQSFTVSASGRLTKVDINVKNDASGTAPLIVKIYSDNGGQPGTLLATSSISAGNVPGAYAYTSARFIEAPSVSTATTYWIVTHQQSEGTNNYKWSSTTSTTGASTSNSGNSWTSQSYAFNYKAYVSTSGKIKGVTRFYRTTAAPITVFAHGTQLYTVNDSTGAITSIKTGLSSGANVYNFQTVNDKLYIVNGVDAPLVYDGSTVSTAGGSPPIASTVILHKNRLFYLEPNTNRVVFTDAGAYETIGSTNFIYVPSPKTSDAVVSMISFQDNLVLFTKVTKYQLFGSDLASFVLRESTAKKGCSGLMALAKDDSFLYFMSYDGVYKYNGGTDQLLSERIDPLLSRIADYQLIDFHVAQNYLHVHYISNGESFEKNTMVYDTKYDEWLFDTYTYALASSTWESQTDNLEVVSGSSVVGQLMYWNVGTSDLGRPIEFEYRTKYHSYDHPSRKHRIKRLYPFFKAGSANYYCDVQIDVDDQNNPTSNLVSLGTSGATWGGGYTWGSGSQWGSNILNPTRITIPGQNRKHQIRFVQNGADNPVRILGYTTYTKLRRAV